MVELHDVRLMHFLLDPAFLAVLGTVAATLLFLFGARRRGAPAALVTVGAIDLFCGLITFTLVAIHLSAVIGRAFSGKGLGGAPAFTYNFRFYSLVLVGLLIAVPAFLCASCARGLTRGDASAWKSALRSSVLLLAVNGPLMPIQGFAIGLTGLALVNLTALAASRERFRSATG